MHADNVGAMSASEDVADGADMQQDRSTCCQAFKISKTIARKADLSSSKNDYKTAVETQHKTL